MRVKFFTVLDESFPCFLESKERGLLFAKKRGVEFTLCVKKILERASDSTRRYCRKALFRLPVLIFRSAFNPFREKDARLLRLNDKIAKVVERDFPFFRERVVYPVTPGDVPRLRTRSPLSPANAGSLSHTTSAFWVSRSRGVITQAPAFSSIGMRKGRT